MGPLWESFSCWVMKAGLPTVAMYHALCLNPFFNVAAEDATGLEMAANAAFTPMQYLFAGKIAKPVLSEQGEVIDYTLEQRFDYQDSSLWVKTVGAYCTLPSSLIVGSVLKGLSLISSDARTRQEKISHSIALGGHPFFSQNNYYKSIGMDIVSFEEAEEMHSLGYERRPEDVEKLKAEKQALREIVELFNSHKIVYWLDCGSCLGAYRYGGNIPWDWDVDLAILQPDFDNVRHVLSLLDPKKYTVQDWSSRDKLKSYLKVYVKESDSLIDIYHFSIDADKKEICSILANEGSVFLPESWRIRERRFIIPTPFNYVFPLKKANFDGVEVFIPNQTEKYLQQRYGQNISPAKIYSPLTGQYEKDLNHPYWKDLYTR